MEIAQSLPLLPGDPRLIDHIVCELKSQGIFDQVSDKQIKNTNLIDIFTSSTLEDQCMMYYLIPHLLIHVYIYYA